MGKSGFVAGVSWQPEKYHDLGHRRRADGSRNGEVEKPLPIMLLDERLPENSMAPIHPKTGRVWLNKQWELVALATEWKYEDDDDLRQSAKEKYEKARVGVVFEERPHFEKSFVMIGCSLKDMAPLLEVYHCHPKTWEKASDEDKAKFEVRTRKDYSFPFQNDPMQAPAPVSADETQHES